MPEIVRKLRIKLFDKDLNQLSDRLVDPDVEFRKGPKGINPGPIELEMFLGSQDDVKNAIEYLNQLSGLVPIAVKTVGKRGRRPKNVTDGATHIEDLKSLIKNSDNPSGLLKELRELGFVGITLPYLKDLGLPIPYTEEDFPNTRFMVRLLRKAKNPLNNSYDPSALVGWKTKEKNEMVVLLSAKEIVIKKTFDGLLKDKITVPAKYKAKFPPYLTLEDRNKFRLEMSKLEKDLELKPTRFYTRWVHDVARINPKDMVFPRIDQIPNPYA